jgi:hypothetical protein
MPSSIGFFDAKLLTFEKDRNPPETYRDVYYFADFERVWLAEEPGFIHFLSPCLSGGRAS